MALPFTAAAGVLECFQTALLLRPVAERPGQICMRAGSEVPFSVGLAEDLCCTGLAWVRVVSIEPLVVPIPGTANFPNADNACQQSGSVATLELGVARCQPFGDANAGPDCNAWTVLALRMDNDAADMRKAVCCYQTAVINDNNVMQVRRGIWEPFQTEGGCAGGTMRVEITYDCTDCEA